MSCDKSEKVFAWEKVTRAIEEYVSFMSGNERQAANDIIFRLRLKLRSVKREDLANQVLPIPDHWIE